MAAQSPISVHGLPPAAHILAGLGLVAGLLMWLLGRKLLRPAFALLGASALGFAGFFAFPAISPATVFGAPSPYVGLAAGGVLGLAAGIVFYRFAVAIVTGAALGTAGVLVAATVLHFEPVQHAARNVATSAPANGSAPTVQTVRGEAPADLPRTPLPVADRVTAFLKSSSEHVRSAWSDLSPHHRIVISVSALSGLFLGLLVGLLAPRKSSAAATALFGAAVWLPSALWLINAMEAPGRTILNQGGAIGWLVVWLTVAAIGFAFQSCIGAGRKRNE